MATRKTPFVIDMPDPAEAVSLVRAREAAWIDDVLFFGASALLMGAALAFGATGAYAQFVEQTASLALLGLWVTRQQAQGCIEMAGNPLYLPALAFALLIVGQFVTGRTEYRYATLSGILFLVPCGAAVLIAGELFTRRRLLRHFCFLLSVFGFAVALFALVQDFSGSDRIYWLVKVRALSASPYGPYANHNHYAGLMEMLVPLAAASAFLERGAKRGLLLFFSAIMAVSIVCSRSRGGILALSVGVIFVSGILFRMSRNRRTLFIALALGALVAVLVIFLGNDKVVARLTETQDSYRAAIYADSLRMWLHRPFLGFGWGTFPTVYPEYRSFYTNLFVNHAHNDYLELLVETGVVGFAITLWFLFAAFRAGLRKVFDRDDHEGGILAIGLLSGIVSLLAHSFLDFNLHIAANAALFFVLCSAVATPYRHHVRQLEFASWEPEEEPLIAETEA